MSIKIGIPPFLLQLVNNNKSVTVEGNTVGDCLQALINLFPKVENVILDKNGALLKYIDVYVNGTSVYPEDLVKPVKNGDELYILNIIVGG
jgi:molybdopterin converting factor small subunit